MHHNTFEVGLPLGDTPSPLIDLAHGDEGEHLHRDAPQDHLPVLQRLDEKDHLRGGDPASGRLVETHQPITLQPVESTLQNQPTKKDQLKKPIEMNQSTNKDKHARQRF